MAKGKIDLEFGSAEKDVAYISLPSHPGSDAGVVVKKMVRLASVIPGYAGPEILLDFVEGDQLIGIEILS